MQAKGQKRGALDWLKKDAKPEALRLIMWYIQIIFAKVKNIIEFDTDFNQENEAAFNISDNKV